MPLSDLLGKRARTASGVEVATPTVRSFYRALSVFGREIDAVRSAARVARAEGVALSVADALPVFLKGAADGRLAFVLDGLTADRHHTREYTEEVARAAADMVAPLAGAIDELLGDPDSERIEEDAVDGAVLLVLGAASRLHIDPMTVMDWPLGLFLDARIAFSREGKDSPQSMRAEMDAIAPEAPSVPVVGGPTYGGA